MDPFIQLSVAAMAFAAFMLPSAELTASAGKSARRTGKGKAGKGKPRCGSPPGGAAGPRAGARPPSPRAAHEPAGPSGRVPEADGREPGDGAAGSGRPGGSGGPSGNDGGGPGRIAAGHGHDGGTGPDRLPKPPPWPFPSDGEFLDLLLSIAESRTPEPEPDRASSRTVRAWDLIRGTFRASRGPDDPRVRCAASRTALSLALKGNDWHLEAAAALAAGAAESFSRGDDATYAGGDASEDGRHLAGEKEFAEAVLAASRAALARMPGREPGTPFPAPAYRLWTAMYPGPASPAPVRPRAEELRAALAEAGRLGAGSAETLAVRSRLGEAVAEEEAWARASVTSLASRCGPGSGGRPASADRPASGTSGDSADSGDSGSPSCAPPEDSALGLLRSASEGLDVLLGRTHPDSLDARERLAGCLAGFAGPGLPTNPHGWELPARNDITEAMEIFMGTAEARAEAAAGTVPADEGGPSPERDGSRLLPDRERAVRLLPDRERAVRLVRQTADERALAAEASAAFCGLVTGITAEQAPFFDAALEAALALPDSGHPVALKFQAHLAETLCRKGNVPAAARIMGLVSHRQAERLGTCSGEAAANFIRLGMIQQILGDPASAAGSFSDALETLEETCLLRARSRGDAPCLQGLPPGRDGRDILEASFLLARCLAGAGDPRSAYAVIARFTDSLPDLPELPADPDVPPSGWPWPPELAGRALCVAGEAAVLLNDRSRGEALLRRAVTFLGPSPEVPIFLSDAMMLLSDVLSERGGRDSSREAARLAEKVAELQFRCAGPDSTAALDSLARAARFSEDAGDDDAAIGLHRKILAARKRLLGPMDEATRESRAEIRRLEGKGR